MSDERLQPSRRDVYGEGWAAAALGSNAPAAAPQSTLPADLPEPGLPALTGALRPADRVLRKATVRPRPGERLPATAELSRVRDTCPHTCPCTSDMECTHDCPCQEEP